MSEKNDIKIEVDQKMPDEMSPEEIEQFMNETITRREAMNFMNGYIGEHILPQLEQQLSAQYNSAYAMIQVLESIIISAGICTLDDIKRCYESYIQKQKEKFEAEAQNKEQ
jgi:hypothetical protein